MVRYATQERGGLPVFVWTFDEDEALREAALLAGAKAVVNKMNREELMSLFDTHGVLGNRRDDGDSARNESNSEGGHESDRRNVA